jgi:hypothetical protein
MAKRLIPDAQVCRRYSIHTSTLRNWDNDPDLKFPEPIRIRNRKFRDEDALDQFDQDRAAAERNESAA